MGEDGTLVRKPLAAKVLLQRAPARQIRPRSMMLLVFWFCRKPQQKRLDHSRGHTNRPFSIAELCPSAHAQFIWSQLGVCVYSVCARCPQQERCIPSHCHSIPPSWLSRSHHPLVVLRRHYSGGIAPARHRSIKSATCSLEVPLPASS